MIPLIIGFGINGWNVYRALRRAGLAPVALDADRDSIFWHARHIRPQYTPEYAGDGLLAALRRLTSGGREYLLISALEETIHYLNGNREKIPPGIHYCFPAREIVEMMLDKRLFYEQAVRLGLPIYPMYFFDESGWRAPEVEILFPCVLKTRAKMYVAGLKKAYKVESRAALNATLQELSRLPGLSPSDILLQQWVDGGDGDVYFCMQCYDAAGRRVDSFTGRKIRQWPPLTGGTASAEPVEFEPAESLTSRFFEGSGMRGIGSMEFKRTPDGSLQMIEPTVCRADYQEGVAVANGHNLPYALYASATGAEYRAERVDRRVAWICAGDDLQSARRQAGATGVSIAAWWRSLAADKEFAIYTSEDPGPFREMVRRKVAGRLERLTKWKRAI